MYCRGAQPYTPEVLLKPALPKVCGTLVQRRPMLADQMQGFGWVT